MRILLCLILVAGLGGVAVADAPMRGGIPSARSSGVLIDINTATAEQLLTLPGMGRAYVQRVIDGRPYSAKNQLVSRGVLPQAVYQRIQTMIIARRITK